MTTAVFHIGYHKTASSYLQKNVFDADQRFLRVDRRKIFDELIYPSPLVFDAGGGSQFVASQIDAASAQGRIAVFSNERLSGGIHTGGNDSLEVLGRIKACAPDARILICVREQRSMIRSLYAQYVKAFGAVSLENYCSGRYTRYRKDLFNLRCLEYDRLVSAYLDTFGSERVSVVPLEWLRRDFERYLRNVYKACGVDANDAIEPSAPEVKPVNARLPHLQTRVLRLTAPLRVDSIPHIGPTYYFRGVAWLCRGAAAAVGRLPLKRLNDKLDKNEQELVNRIVGDRYVNSNRRLQALTDVDFKKLGYTI